MITLHKIFNQNIPIFGNIFAKKGDNRSATLADLNSIVSEVKAAMQGRPSSFFFTVVDGGASGTTFSLVAGGSAACTCADCGTGNSCSGCPPANTSSFYKCGSSSADLTNSSTGVYRITLAPNFDYTKAYVRFGHLTDGTNTISITKVSNTRFDIEVKDSTGTLVAGKLVDALVEILIF